MREHVLLFCLATIEAAIACGCKHYSERGELLATTLAVLECLQREGFVTVEEPDIACGGARRPVESCAAYNGHSLPIPAAS
jgi:hypothetical protein